MTGCCPQPIGAPLQKVVIIGSAGVGKTSLTQLILGQEQASKPALPSAAKSAYPCGVPTPSAVGALSGTAAVGPLPTVGVDFATRALDMEGRQRPARLHIFDASGQKRFKDVVESYLTTLGDHDAVIVTYDITDRTTFEELDKYIRRVRCLAQGLPQIAIVGMKADLAKRQGCDFVSSEDAQAIAEELQVRIAVQVACPPAGQSGEEDLVSSPGQQMLGTQSAVDAELLRPLLQQCSEAASSSARAPVRQQKLHVQCPAPPAVMAPTSCSSEAEKPLFRCSRPIRRCLGFA